MTSSDIAVKVPISKKFYTSPMLTIYGDISEITLKDGGIRDQNHSDSNDMGDKIKRVPS